MKKSNMKTLETPVGAFTPPSIGRQAGMPVAGRTGEVVPMDETVSQTLSALPMGQNISVNVHAASPHLPFGEWVKRGVLAALGNGLLYFPRLIGRMLEAVLLTILGFIKTAAIIVLIPTLIWLGFMLKEHLANSGSVREGAASVTVQSGELIKGIADGTKAERDPLADKKPGKAADKATDKE